MTHSSKNKSFEEKIKQAKNVNLVDFCLENNILLNNARSHNPNLAEHDSLVFFPDNLEQQWYRFSTQIGGDSIEFVRYYYDLDFKEAVNKLVDKEYSEIDHQKELEAFEYDRTNEVDTFEKAHNYLVNKRKIDPNLVLFLHEKGFLRQDKRDNVVFKWIDYENRKICGANEQGTYTPKDGGRSFKCIQRNSERGHGFNVKIGDPERLKFFESSIDLLSYMSLNKNDIKNTWYISMEGLKQSVFKQYLHTSYHMTGDAPKSINLCVDNDEAGQQFMSWVEENEVFKREYPPEGKDWNDYLKEVKKAPIERRLDIKEVEMEL